MNFEDCEAKLTAQTKSRLAAAVFAGTELPQNLTEEEKTFCFGLYLFTEYDQREEIKKYILN